MILDFSKFAFFDKSAVNNNRFDHNKYLKIIKCNNQAIQGVFLKCKSMDVVTVLSKIREAGV